MPGNALQKALLAESATPESFFILRSNFAKSLAVMSVVHWIMSIGDRNLGNFLIDRGNGELIGVDFDTVFGMGIRSLKIPEVVPFRLTAQFVNVLKPLETTGFLAKSMVHVLRTFSMESESLMAALEVFIHEPTTDYTKPSDKDSSTEVSFLSADSSSDPEVHLKTIEAKLNGLSPMTALVNDINRHVEYAR